MATPSSLYIRVAANIDELKRNLAEGKNQIETTTAAMSKLANSFTGDKLIQAAHNVTAAVDKVGGSARLTQAEQDRVNATLEKALEKYRVLGREAPAAMQQLYEATKRVEVPTENLTNKLGGAWSAVTKLAGGFGIGLGLTALLAFGGRVVDTASNLGDLSSKLGTTAEFAQRMSYVAGQSGTTIDTVGASVAKMNVLLSEGDSGAVGALRQMGLSFQEIRAGKPEEAFLSITDAIAKVPDPMKQAELSVRLFGKSGQELLPAIKDGIRDVASQTTVMSDETVRKLKEAGDAWDRFKSRVGNTAGTLFVPVIEALDRMIDMADRLAHLDPLGAFVAFKGLAPELAELKANGGSVAATFADIAAGAKAAHPEMYRVAAGAKSAAMALEEQKDIAPSVLAALAAFDESNKKNEEQIKKNVAASESYTARIRDLASALSGAKLQETIKEQADAVALANKETGVQIQQVPALVRQINEWRDAGMKIPTVLADIAAKYQGLAFAKTIPSDLTAGFKELRAELQLLNQAPGNINIKPLNISTDPTKFLKGLNLPSIPNNGGLTDEQLALLQKINGGVTQLAASFAQLGQIAGDSFQPILRGVGSVIGALDAATKSNTLWSGSAGVANAMFSSQATTTQKWASAAVSGAAIASGAMAAWTASANDGTKAAGAFHGSFAGAQAGAMFGPWGAAIGAAGGAVIGLIHTLSAGRRAVEDFAASFGGFDALHAKMGAALGDLAETLWIKLTQEVKKGDKAGAASIIDDIQRQLAAAAEKAANTPASLAGAAGYQTIEQLQAIADKAKSVYEYMKSSGLYTADAIADAFQKAKDAQIAALGDTARAQSAALDEQKKKIADQLTSLEAKRKSIMDSIAGEAPEAAMGVVERQARAQLAVIDRDHEALAKQLGEIGDSAKDSLDTVAAKATTVQADVARILTKPLTIPVSFDFGNMPAGGWMPTSLPAGFTPTASSSSSSGGATPFQINLDGRVVAEGLIPHWYDAAARYGLRS